MKSLCTILTVAILAGCGVETASTAATAATIKKQEMDQAKKTMGEAQQKIDDAAKQVQIRVEQSGSADKQ